MIESISTQDLDIELVENFGCNKKVLCTFLRTCARELCNSNQNKMGLLIGKCFNTDNGHGYIVRGLMAHMFPFFEPEPRGCVPLGSKVGFFGMQLNSHNVMTHHNEVFLTKYEHPKAFLIKINGKQKEDHFIVGSEMHKGKEVFFLKRACIRMEVYMNTRFFILMEYNYLVCSDLFFGNNEFFNLYGRNPIILKEGRLSIRDIALIENRAKKNTSH